MGIFSKKKEEVKVISKEKNLDAIDGGKDKKTNSIKNTAEKNEEAENKEIEKVKKEGKAAKKKVKESKVILAEKILLKPWISEKTSNAMGKGVYTFHISSDASKNSIKDAVESLFNVAVKSVNISNVKGKFKNFKKKSACRSDRKKAIVCLREGHKIEEMAV